MRRAERARITNIKQFDQRRESKAKTRAKEKKRERERERSRRAKQGTR